MRHFDPKAASLREVADLLVGGIGPRPIALVSTTDAQGRRNLSPFSFFNAFGSNPPTVAFSAARRLRDASLKDTYKNLVATKECVVQVVTYPMVRQASLSSTEYGSEVDEFAKSGLTPVPSDLVRPSRVKESPFQMECVLKQMIALGEGNASGNLAICEVVKFHVAEDLFVDGVIQPDRIDLVGRMGGDFYTRASGASIFRVKKPLQTRGIGYDQLPEFIRRSQVFTANNLGQLGNSEKIPDGAEVQAFAQSHPPGEADEEAFWRAERRGDYATMLGVALAFAREDVPKARQLVETAAKAALDRDDDAFAWRAALLGQKLMA